MSRRYLKGSVPDIDKISNEEDSSNVSACSDYLPTSPSPVQTSIINDEQTQKKMFQSQKKKTKDVSQLKSIELVEIESIVHWSSNCAAGNINQVRF